MLITFLNITECVNDLEAKIKDPQRFRISKIEKRTINYTKQEPDTVCYTVVFHSSMHVFKRKNIMNRVVDFVNHIYIVDLKEKMVYVNMIKQVEHNIFN